MVPWLAALRTKLVKSPSHCTCEVCMQMCRGAAFKHFKPLYPFNLAFGSFARLRSSGCIIAGPWWNGSLSGSDVIGCTRLFNAPTGACFWHAGFLASIASFKLRWLQSPLAGQGRDDWYAHGSQRHRIVQCDESFGLKFGSSIFTYWSDSSLCKYGWFGHHSATDARSLCSVWRNGHYCHATFWLYGSSQLFLWLQELQTRLHFGVFFPGISWYFIILYFNVFHSFPSEFPVLFKLWDVAAVSMTRSFLGGASTVWYYLVKL